MTIEVPSFDQLMWPTLKALKVMGGSATNAEILDKIIENEQIPERVQNVIHTDDRQTKLHYNLAWAKTYLRIAGALENSARGVWAITIRGESLNETDINAIPAKVRKLHASKRRTEQQEKSVEGVEDFEREEDSSTDAWKDRLLEALISMKPDSFERLCQRLLRESGFVKVQVTGRSGDGGIDGVGILRVALLFFQVFFQCKRYKGSVPSRDVRDFRGAMVGRGDKGIFITTGTFTAEAQKEATRDGAPAIDLIDGEYLCTLLKDLRLGVETEQVERVKVNSDWYTQF